MALGPPSSRGRSPCFAMSGRLGTTPSSGSGIRRRSAIPAGLPVRGDSGGGRAGRPEGVEEAEAAAALSASLPKVICGLSLLGKYFTKAMSDSTPRRRLIHSWVE